MQQLTNKITTHYTTLSLFFEDWYFDWKIDNSIGTGLIAPKITLIILYPFWTNSGKNGVLILGSYDEFTSMQLISSWSRSLKDPSPLPSIVPYFYAITNVMQ